MPDEQLINLKSCKMQAKKVNIVILNYNGRELLKKYLASVVQACRRSRHNCRVTVVDNRSSDASVDFIRQNFKDVHIYEAKENKVLCSLNDYYRGIDDDIVILLNTDIRVDPDFIDPMVEHFSDNGLFFVAPKELGMESGKYQGNLNKVVFRLGILSAVPWQDDYDRPHYNISIGAGAFDRRKLLELGGYDDLYLPGIYEDFDLCYRGWKHGWKGVYEPRSAYYHEGSTSFNAKYGASRKAFFAYRNSFLFFWKNVTSPGMISIHIICIPLLLAAALIRGRWNFFKAFFVALGMLPEALKRRRQVASQFKISDDELIRRSRQAYYTQKQGASEVNKNFYDKFYKKVKTERTYFNEYKYFLELIGNTDGKVILSLGNGDKEPFFEKQIASDISFEGIKKVSCSRRLVFDAHSAPFKKQSIDIIYGWQVFHHLDADKFLPELKAILKKDGRAVFVDNAYSPHWRLIRNIFPKEKSDPKEDLREEYLSGKITEYGFCKFRAKRFNFFSYLFNKTMRTLGFNLSLPFLLGVDKFCSRWQIFRKNLRNMVWSFENQYAK